MNRNKKYSTHLPIRFRKMYQKKIRVLCYRGICVGKNVSDFSGKENTWGKGIERV